MSEASGLPLHVLLAEDNPADVVFFREAARACGAHLAISAVDNGQDALNYLRRPGPDGSASRPDVLVLDLNLPLMNGRELLTAMAADAALGDVPVAILTTSASEEHLVEAHPTLRCAYFVKTPDFRQMQEIIRQIILHAGKR